MSDVNCAGDRNIKQDALADQFLLSNHYTCIARMPVTNHAPLIGLLHILFLTGERERGREGERERERERERSCKRNSEIKQSDCVVVRPHVTLNRTKILDRAI